MSAIFPTYKKAAVADLIPYARNSRTHSDAQVAQIAASIREFGFTNPVLVDGQGGIIAGHGRVMAARKLGMAEVPVIELAHLTPAQKRAYVIADNQLALNAGWEFDMLSVELDELRADGFELGVLGFDTKQLNELIGTPNDAPNDEASIVDETRHLLLIECENEPELEALFGEMQKRGLNCKVMS